MSKRERRRGGRSKRARVRGKEGDFFSSCKPFQLCSGLRTETGSERKREQSLGAHTSQREKERKKREEELGLRGTLFHSQYGVRSRRKDTAEKTAKREGSVSWDCLLVKRGKTLPAKQSLDCSWEGCLGLCPLDTVPRLTALPCSPACLLAWLVQEPAFSPPLFCLPPDAPFHFSLTPFKILPAFDLLYHLSPGAVDDLRIKEKNSNTDRHFFMKKQTAFLFVLELALCSNRG